MINITVLSLIDRIACFYSLSPFFNNSDKQFRFTFTDDPHWCLTKDTNSILVMMRQFIKPDVVDLELLAALRKRYDRIAFFHDDAGGGIPRLEVVSLVDLFYTKALFRDRSLYGRELYGKELYSDYYHSKYGIVDNETKKRAVLTDPVQLAKLRLSWNIGIGEYPRTKWKQRITVEIARRTGLACVQWVTGKNAVSYAKAMSNPLRLPVHARIGLISRPSISFQRSLILEKIGKDPRFLTEPVSQRRFNRETAMSRVVLSPFGWGELCLRDFEAVRGGAMLLKPDMSHLETWPDIFVPFKTYVPFSWDAEDLVEKASWYLEHEDERRTIVEAAVNRYREQHEAMQERFTAIMSEIAGI